MDDSQNTSLAQPFAYHPALDGKRAYGEVCYGDRLAGYIGDAGGGNTVFQYAPKYLASGWPAIAYTLPLTSEPYIANNGLHPFFDNLVAEGWLEQWQCRKLGKRQASRFELLLAFGQDCAGAIAIRMESAGQLKDGQGFHHLHRQKELRLSRASLSGVQPKLAIIQDKRGEYRETGEGEISTHIAKFISESTAHEGIVNNEYLTTLATRALLPNDQTIDCAIGSVKDIATPALIIPRFDRDNSGGRIHFEEFNQLLGLPSDAKYEGSYKDMADFILNNDACLPTQAYILFQRILAGILLGNTDMHLKNFAMFHAGAGKTHGMQLTPGYDLVSAYLLDYKELALSLAGRSNSPIHLAEFAPRHIWRLGDYFLLPKPAITLAVQRLGRNIPAAKQALAGAKHGDNELKQQLTELMEKLWKQGFAPIGNT